MEDIVQPSCVAERKTFCCAGIASCGMFLAGYAAWITINTCHSIGSNGGMRGFLLPHHCMARDTSSIWVIKVNRAQVIIMSPWKLHVRTHLWTVQTCSERMQT